MRIYRITAEYNRMRDKLSSLRAACAPFARWITVRLTWLDGAPTETPLGEGAGILNVGHLRALAEAAKEPTDA